MKNPIKVLAITNTILLVGLIIFVLVVKQKTEGGEKVGYFMGEDETAPVNTNLTPTASN